MLLYKNCFRCKIDLTTQNAIKRKDITSGFGGVCKSCSNINVRSRTKDKNCEYCDKKCRAKGKRFFCSIICRFKAYYIVDEKSGCWLWREKLRDSRGGYGKFIIGKKRFKAHRVSFELFKGPIVLGNLICHSCDNPPCVNPNHLWQGTASDNQIDCIKKGRHNMGNNFNLKKNKTRKDNL